MSEQNQTYVGDGVYAEFTGWSINIRVNNHENPIAVVFEPEVLQNLVDYARKRGFQIK